MTTRAQLANHALTDNGYLNGCGYPGPGNKFSQYLHRPNEFWCGDTVTAWFEMMGLKLPVMQPGVATGFAFCPSAVEYGRQHGIVIPSYQSQPGDIVLFDWNGDGKADHTELATSRSGSELFTAGGDSGPSNVDAYRGQGGVHRHSWYVPAGVGNNRIIAVLNAGRLVSFTSNPPAGVPSWWHRDLRLVTPLMYGEDVVVVQGKVGATKDGWYGKLTEEDVYRYQEVHGLTPDGVVGPVTATHMGP